jgi:hypothetical protein
MLARFCHLDAILVGASQDDLSFSQALFVLAPADNKYALSKVQSVLKFFDLVFGCQKYVSHCFLGDDRRTGWKNGILVGRYFVLRTEPFGIDVNSIQRNQQTIY